MSLSNTHNFQVNFNNAESIVLGAFSGSVQDNIAASLAFANGTGAAQVNQHCEKLSVTLAAGAGVTYTLSALTDSIGRTIPLAHLQTLMIQVTSRTAGDFLVVGDPAASLTHPFSAIFDGATPATNALKVYDIFAIGVGNTVDGYAVGSGATDQLLVKNGGANPITFTVGFAGRDV